MRLDVWMEGLEEPVGSLERRDDNAMRFTYAEPDLPLRGRISMSMPIRKEAYGDAPCRAFFGNLLFEGRELERVMSLHGIDRDDIAGLLAHLGADCPGAISITPEGQGPGKRPGVFPDDYEEIDEERLEGIVRTLHEIGQLPETQRDPSPVAGVQPKIALVAFDGRYYLPLAGSGAPTTHILKVSPRSDAHLTRREHALLELARDLGLAVIQTEYIETPAAGDGHPIGAILTVRFDRSIDGGRIRRIHSEDFAQALGIPRQLKYERDADGETAREGFSLRAIDRIASQVAVPARFRLEFLRQTLFNLAVGNTDNHAKNGSILYRGERGELAPLYDVVPVTMDDTVTHEFAFRLGGAAFAEDLMPGALADAKSDLGFRASPLTRSERAVLHGVAAQLDMLEERSDKLLADAVATQLSVVNDALDLKLIIPERDLFPRKIRDARAAVGGWGLPS
ncbi:HipA domain-containing protein [Halovulum sp. GXIMD14794]